MKNLLKIIFVSLLLLLPIETALSAEDSQEISKIREQFQSWQKVLNKETIAKGKKFFEISVGGNFKKAEWVTKIKDDKDFIWSEVTLIKDAKLGTMFYIFETSPSGDWSHYADHYYWPTGELFFVYWKYRTFMADEPSRIERRLYFNKAGKLIRSLESVYKISTQEKIKNPNYMSHEVTYWKDIKALPFYNLLNEK